MIHTSYSILETKRLAKEILRRLGSKHIILLTGELGSGKTVLTQALAEELEIKDNLVSPTYVLMKVYDVPSGKFKRFVHVDLYRIEYNQNIDDLGLTDYLDDPTNLVVVEWPERILGSWENNSFPVTLSYGDKSTIRTLDF